MIICRASAQPSPFTVGASGGKWPQTVAAHAIHHAVAAHASCGQLCCIGCCLGVITSVVQAHHVERPHVMAVVQLAFCTHKFGFEF